MLLQLLIVMIITEQTKLSSPHFSSYHCTFCALLHVKQALLTLTILSHTVSYRILHLFVWFVIVRYTYDSLNLGQATHLVPDLCSMRSCAPPFRLWDHKLVDTRTSHKRELTYSEEERVEEKGAVT